MSTFTYIVQLTTNEKWEVVYKRNGENVKGTEIYDTQTEAYERAVELANERGNEEKTVKVVVIGEDGEARLRHKYPREDADAA